MISVACPSSVETGGVELLHQLTAELRKYTPAKIWYPGGGENMPAYQIYGNDVTEKPEGTIILPEIWAEMYSFFQDSIIYWESVDNYLSRYQSKNILPFNTLNLIQSEYAKQFVLDHFSTDIIEISDYINDDFFKPYHPTARWDDVVLYNPVKGYEFTKMLMTALPEVEFVPLKWMTRKQLIHMMRCAKLYIDFGSHPGKDRMPREAAICGCCVITGKDGSAAYFEDVGIPEEYKFDRTECNIPAIASKIREVLSIYPSDDFEGYREVIKGEKQRFEQGVKQLAERLS